jgi:hypothetical protein
VDPYCYYLIALTSRISEALPDKCGFFINITFRGVEGENAKVKTLSLLKCSTLKIARVAPQEMNYVITLGASVRATVARSHLAYG